MYDNDYIIAINENGQPYIAHAYTTDNKGANTRQGMRNAIRGAGSGKRGFHKYLAKGIMNGKMFYAYTQQELDRLRGKAKNAAKKAWGSKAGRFIDEHDAGITESIMRKRLLRKSKKALKNGNKTDAARYINRAEELRTESARERKAAKEAVRSKYNSAKDKVESGAKKAWGSKAGRFIDEHDAGVSEAIMRQRLLKKYKKALENGDTKAAIRYRNRAEELRTEAARERKKVKDKFKSNRN